MANNVINKGQIICAAWELLNQFDCRPTMSMDQETMSFWAPAKWTTMAQSASNLFPTLYVKDTKVIKVGNNVTMMWAQD